MINDEIKKVMTNFRESTETGEISAEFAFPKSFIGFEGHFPTTPILPGVCQIEMITATISRHLNKKMKLLSVSRAKFLNTVQPEEKVTVSGICTESENTFSGKFKITKTVNNETVNVSRISLKLKIK